MAERFVIGFSVDLDALEAVVGSGRSPSDLIEAAGGSDELDELLAEWAPADPLTGEQAIAAITSGALQEDRAYEYRRTLELLAAAVGRRFDEEIDVVMTYYLPNDTHGRWKPVLEALGLSRIADLWGQSNHPFPWGEGKSRADWPIATFLTPEAVVAAAAELAALPDDAVSQLPDTLLVEADDEDAAPEVREELEAGLETLDQWLSSTASEGRTLLLLMDGSQ